MYVGHTPFSSVVKTPHPLVDTPPHVLTDREGDVWGLCYADQEAPAAYYNLVAAYGDVCWNPLTLPAIDEQYGVVCRWWLAHLPYPNSVAFLRSCSSCRSVGYVNRLCTQCQALQIAHRITGCQDCMNSDAVYCLRQNVIVPPYMPTRYA